MEAGSNSMEEDLPSQEAILNPCVSCASLPKPHQNRHKNKDCCVAAQPTGRWDGGVLSERFLCCCWAADRATWNKGPFQRGSAGSSLWCGCDGWSSGSHLAATRQKARGPGGNVWGTASVWGRWRDKPVLGCVALCFVLGARFCFSNRNTITEIEEGLYPYKTCRLVYNVRMRKQASWG